MNAGNGHQFSMAFIHLLSATCNFVCLFVQYCINICRSGGGIAAVLCTDMLSHIQHEFQLCLFTVIVSTTEVIFDHYFCEQNIS